VIGKANDNRNKYVIKENGDQFDRHQPVEKPQQAIFMFNFFTYSPR
jgi:hypothetical protein